jgi:hypothetical protein
MSKEKPRGKITMMNILKENSSQRRALIKTKFMGFKIDNNVANKATDEEIELFLNLKKSIDEYFKGDIY